jgi:hypothetical protein
MKFTITADQAEALIEVLQDHNDGESVTFEKPGVDAALLVGFSLATVEISGGGTVEEN